LAEEKEDLRFSHLGKYRSIENNRTRRNQFFGIFQLIILNLNSLPAIHSCSYFHFDGARSFLMAWDISLGMFALRSSTSSLWRIEDSSSLDLKNHF